MKDIVELRIGTISVPVQIAGTLPETLKYIP